MSPFLMSVSGMLIGPKKYEFIGEVSDSVLKRKSVKPNVRSFYFFRRRKQLLLFTAICHLVLQRAVTLRPQEHKNEAVQLMLIKNRTIWSSRNYVNIGNSNINNKIIVRIKFASNNISSKRFPKFMAQSPSSETDSLEYTKPSLLNTNRNKTRSLCVRDLWMTSIQGDKHSLDSDAFYAVISRNMSSIFFDRLSLLCVCCKCECGNGRLRQ